MSRFHFSLPNCFADLRPKKAEELIANIRKDKARNVNRISPDGRKSVSFFQLINKPRMKPKDIITGLQEHCKEAVRGRSVLLIEDIKHVVLQDHADFINPDDEHFGPVGPKNKLGFLLHPVLAMDIEDSMPLGISSATIWSPRASDPSLSSKGKGAGRSKKDVREQETSRWLKLIEQGKEVLAGAKQVVAVTEREGEIYELFCRVPDGKTDLVVGCAQDQRMEVEGEERQLMVYLDSQPVASSYNLEVNTTRQQKARTAKMELKFCPVRILSGMDQNTSDPAGKDIFVVDACEAPETVPKVGKALHWRLFTTLEVQTAEDAARMVEWYAKRWQMEQFFRMIKLEIRDLEYGELYAGKDLWMLALLDLELASKIMQLYHVRDGMVNRPASVMFSKAEIVLLAGLMPRFEGNTQKQKNPHPPQSLAWAAWLVARLGGWKGYQSAFPPGPATFKWGFQKIKTLIYAFSETMGKDALKD